jgi:hypothetical protein
MPAAADLLLAARDLIGSGIGRPRQANLTRAASTIYYAMFHHLCRTSADLLVGSSGADRASAAWAQVYRSIDHRQVRAVCANKEQLAGFPPAIRNFAFRFLNLQQKRQSADYDPATRLTKLQLRADLALAETAIAQFTTQPRADRRAFVVLVVFKQRG